MLQLIQSNSIFVILRHFVVYLVKKNCGYIFEGVIDVFLFNTLPQNVIGLHSYKILFCNLCVTAAGNFTV